MNMKKMLSLALAGVMALSLMACSAQNGRRFFREYLLAQQQPVQ